MLFMGIDPGVSGGLAVLRADGAVVSAVKMPETERDLLDFLIAHATDARAALERVRSSPQMGVVSAWSFGRGYGALRMGLTAAGIVFDEVLPHKWQSVIGCLTGGDKNVSKRAAQDLFGMQVKVTHAVSDALLIAEFVRRREVGNGHA